MKINLVSLYDKGEWSLFSFGTPITLLQVWMVVEGAIVLARLRHKA